jgi:hypothetical protein
MSAYMLATIKNVKLSNHKQKLEEIVKDYDKVDAMQQRNQIVVISADARVCAEELAIAND